MDVALDDVIQANRQTCIVAFGLPVRLYAVCMILLRLNRWNVPERTTECVCVPS